MCGIFTIPGSFIFGCVCDIQNGSFCNYWLFTLEISKLCEHIGKKIRMAINNRRDFIRPAWLNNYDVDVMGYSSITGET